MTESLQPTYPYCDRDSNPQNSHYRELAHTLACTTTAAGINCCTDVNPMKSERSGKKNYLQEEEKNPQEHFFNFFCKVFSLSESLTKKIIIHIECKILQGFFFFSENKKIYNSFPHRMLNLFHGFTNNIIVQIIQCLSIATRTFFRLMSR